MKCDKSPKVRRAYIGNPTKKHNDRQSVRRCNQTSTINKNHNKKLFINGNLRARFLDQMRMCLTIGKDESMDGDF